MPVLHSRIDKSMNTADAKRILETALICSAQPLPVRELRVLFDDALAADTVKSLLLELQDEWAQRGLELVSVASGWRFQSRHYMRDHLDRLHPEKPPRYTRAALETLAIIAYRQPVTRGDMEDIRGVTINSLILKQLEDRNWVEVIGHKETVGRPALYATTKTFLDDLGLESIAELPTIDNPAQQAALAGALEGPMQADLPIDVEQHAPPDALHSIVSAPAQGADASTPGVEKVGGGSAGIDADADADDPADDVSDADTGHVFAFNPLRPEEGSDEVAAPREVFAHDEADPSRAIPATRAADPKDENAP